MVGNFFLHPAILIASGFECLNSSDVRFLNASRKHFNPHHDNFSQILLITPTDFELGGIFNPTDRMLEPIIAYKQAQERIPDFPYLTKSQIVKYIYQERLEITFQKVIHELLQTIKGTLGYNDTNISRLFDSGNTNARAMKLLQKTIIYKQINALHKCGVGNRLSDAFAFVFHKYRMNHLD